MLSSDMADYASDDNCDIDALADLLDDASDLENENDSKQSGSLAGNDVRKEASLDTGKGCESLADSEAEQLKRKLQEMEKQMAELREKLGDSGSKKPAIKDVGLDFTPTAAAPVVKKDVESCSEVHKRNPYSSDEEGDGPSGSQFNSYGRFVKQRLAHQSSSSPAVVDRLKGLNCPEGWKSKAGSLTNLSQSSLGSSSEKVQAGGGFTDPFFGINILNPLISSVTLRDRMEGRKLIKLPQIKSYMRGGDIQDDWVTMGVIVHKSEPRTSQKGKKYAIWKLSDMKDCTKTCSFFLFSEVFTTHWKMAVGSVIGLLNPNFLKNENEGKSSNEDISFTVDHHQKVLHVGSSKDLSWCRANRKDGSRCTSVVNKSECEFCIYHIRNEFKKSSSKRSEIQSFFSGTGVSNRDGLKKKVLGNQEVFYGGKVFSGKVVAPPASKAKDNKILESLKLQGYAQQLMDQELQLAKEKKIEFKERLQNPTAGSRNLLRCMEAKSASPSVPAPTASPAAIKSVTAKDLLEQHKKDMLKRKESQQRSASVAAAAAAAVPQLGRGNDFQAEIDLCDQVATFKFSSPSSSSSSRPQQAKLKALRLIQQKGPLKATDPNKPIAKPTTPELQERIRKRVLSADSQNSDRADDQEKPAKRSKAEWDKMLEAKSSHAHLVDELEVQKTEDYFNKMEKKDQLEIKMTSTFEIKTTAVTCPKCKYTALSASELCRKEGHPVRTIKATKRFFKCKDCQQRTMTLDRIPKRCCTHCNGSNWEKVAMAKERKGPLLPHEELKLRGDEIKNLNS